jgi:hypothetical protein
LPPVPLHATAPRSARLANGQLRDGLEPIRRNLEADEGQGQGATAALLDAPERTAEAVPKVEGKVVVGEQPRTPNLARIAKLSRKTSCDRYGHQRPPRPRVVLGQRSRANPRIVVRRRSRRFPAGHTRSRSDHVHIASLKLAQTAERFKARLEAIDYQLVVEEPEPKPSYRPARLPGGDS